MEENELIQKVLTQDVEGLNLGEEDAKMLREVLEHPEFTKDRLASVVILGLCWQEAMEHAAPDDLAKKLGFEKDVLIAQAKHVLKVVKPLFGPKTTDDWEALTAMTFLLGMATGVELVERRHA